MVQPKILFPLLAWLPLAGCGLLQSWHHVETELSTRIFDTGVIAEDLVLGGGAPAALGDTVTLHYVATFEDGTPFDSSRNRDKPLTFILGEAPLAGWNEGIIGMRIGGRRILTLPPERAYGSAGIPGLVPGNATLVFEVELLAPEG